MISEFILKTLGLDIDLHEDLLLVLGVEGVLRVLADLLQEASPTMVASLEEGAELKVPMTPLVYVTFIFDRKSYVLLVNILQLVRVAMVLLVRGLLLRCLRAVEGSDEWASDFRLAA